MENADPLEELLLLPNLQLAEQWKVLERLAKYGDIIKIDQGRVGPYFVVVTETAAKSILHKPNKFRAFPSGEFLPPKDDDIKRRVLSMVDGDLHKEIRSALLKRLRKSYNMLCDSIDCYLEQGIAEAVKKLHGFEFTNSLLGNLAPLAVCNALDIPKADQWKLVQLVRELMSESVKDTSALLIELNDYLCILLTLQIKCQAGALYQLYGELIDQERITFEDALHNISLLFEASLHTVTSVMVSVLLNFSENQNHKTVSDDELSLLQSQALMRALPIHYVYRRCDKELEILGKTIEPGAIVVIPMALWRNNSCAVHAMGGAAFGVGNHSCPGRMIADAVLQRFIRSLYANVREVEIIEVNRNENKVATIYDKVLVRFVGV